MGSMGCPGRPMSITLAVLIALRIAPTTTAPTTSVYDPRSGQHVPRDAYLETMAAFARRAEANITRCAAERGAPLSPVTPGRVVVWHPLAGSGLGNQLEALANAVLYSLISSRRLELTSFENAPQTSLVAYLCAVFDCGYPASTRSKEEIKRMPNYKPHKPCDEAFFNEKRGLSCHARSNTTLLRMASSTRMGGYGASSKNPWASCVGRLLGCYGFATGDNCAVGQALRLALPGVAQPLLDVAGRRFNGSVARLQRALDAPKPTHLYSAALHIRTVDNAMIHELNPNVSAHAIERLILGNNPFWHCIRKKLAAQIDESGIRRVFVASDNAYLHERLPGVLALGDDGHALRALHLEARPHVVGAEEAAVDHVLREAGGEELGLRRALELRLRRRRPRRARAPGEGGLDRRHGAEVRRQRVRRDGLGPRRGAQAAAHHGWIIFMGTGLPRLHLAAFPLKGNFCLASRSRDVLRFGALTWASRRLSHLF